jgi:hypothetical protein
MDKKRKLVDISADDAPESRRKKSKKYSDEEEVLSDAEGTKIIH